jgi:two-component system, NarL family, response regulator DesR
VLLANGDRALLNRLQTFLAGQRDLEVVAACADGGDTLAQAIRLRPDVALLDADLSGIDALELTRRMRAENMPTSVVIISAIADDERVIEAMRLGVRWFLVESMPPRLIAECIRQVRARGVTPQGLTPRETEIAVLAAQGVPTNELARRLGITEGTVKLHLHHVYKKLELKGRVALMRYARDHGLL